MGIFKGRLDLNKTVETAKEAVDKLFFTDEEKADQFMKMADKTVEFYGKTLEENTTRSKTRRWIAYMVIGVNVILAIIASVLFVLGKPYEGIIEIARAFSLPMAFITAIAFFFGGYYFKNIKLRSDRNKK